MGAFLSIYIVFLSGQLVFAHEGHETTTAKQSQMKAQFYPYVPEKKEYGFELGSMWEGNTLYWLGANYGHHIGRCMFANSQTCQQYADIIGGVGGREGLTNGLLLGSIRWQFVSFPKVFSPLARVFMGVMNIRDEKRDQQKFTYGVGYGFATSVHENLDFKLELRIGKADKIFAQTFFSFALKIDKWVDYFADKIQNVGESTVKATGEVFKKGIETPKEVVDWLLLIDKKTEKSNTQPDNQSDSPSHHQPNQPNSQTHDK